VRLLPSVALHFMVRTSGIWKNGSRMVTASFMEIDEDASKYVLGLVICDIDFVCVNIFILLIKVYLILIFIKYIFY